MPWCPSPRHSAIIVSLATDGAVKMDAVKEAAMDEHAMLRKASDQQNAQWRINEARLRTLGVKKARRRGAPILRPRPSPTDTMC